MNVSHLSKSTSRLYLHMLFDELAPHLEIAQPISQSKFFFPNLSFQISF